MIYFKHFLLSGVLFVIFYSLLHLTVTWPPHLVFISAWSIVAFAMYALDKQLAGLGKMRVPEIVLLFVAFCGFSVGAFLARVMFNHKMTKTSFNIKFFASFIAQLALYFHLFGLDFNYFPIG